MPASPSRRMPGRPLKIAGPTLSHLEQLIDALIAGVILIDPTGVILSANPAALEMHGVDTVEGLGVTVDDYVQRFTLRYRDGRRLARREYPLIRLLAGESFPDLVVEVTPVGEDEPRWVHQVRDVSMDEDGGEPDCLALVIHDVSERYDAEGRFEAMFQANPCPGADRPGRRPARRAHEPGFHRPQRFHAQRAGRQEPVRGRPVRRYRARRLCS